MSAQIDTHVTGEQFAASRRGSLAAILMLIAQFLLGMGVNLFVVTRKTIPVPTRRNISAVWFRASRGLFCMATSC